MIKAASLVYSWAIIGAGPAGLASAGLLLDAGVPASDIIIIDPEFSVGDFGKYWGEVFSNTSVELFMRFFTDIQCFNFTERQKVFPIESLPLDGYCQLKAVREPLQWITNQLRDQIDSFEGYASDLKVHHGAWSVRVANKTIRAKKVILATGGTPKSLSHQGVDEITLYDALNPSHLSQIVNPDDKVAVFGSSHSSMIIMKNQAKMRSPRMQTGRLAIRSITCWLSSYETKFHSTSSRMYVSCSSLKTCSMKRL